MTLDIQPASPKAQRANLTHRPSFALHCAMNSSMRTTTVRTRAYRAKAALALARP